ncbi:NAD(P)H-hydrate dehydratase [Candidatus Dojkabacteria bacterium]|uniref:ADP-dependent (S)-NAD(P)H-hydrate dehydratase n=1 Tax=Candidatus Dojkabacteria bacterium TaxID=2099670 RepID=A0A5C7J3M7_9BACT|nr:MAG: NAD(P)H-hydrate dehydratase [Candidatus Dojkabacteria bacterium]
MISRFLLPIFREKLLQLAVCHNFYLLYHTFMSTDLGYNKQMVSISPEENLSTALKDFALPNALSHKGQNGKLLVIGGSSIFHAASIWAAEAASHMVDMVHYASTQENAEIMVNLKSRFVDGIVIRQKDLPSYADEDDCILIGPGMERGEVSEDIKNSDMSFTAICELKNEADYTYSLIKFLIHNFPQKRFVFDAAALQMMNPQWLTELDETPIVTPHAKEFEKLFEIDIANAPLDEKRTILQKTAEKYNATILFKQIVDVVATPKDTTVITGGNAGLTKGGTGDVLAGITAALYTKNSARSSALLASFLLKKTAEDLFNKSGTLYNTSDLIRQLPLSAKSTLFDN